MRVEPRRGLHIRIRAAEQRSRERQHRDEQYRPNHLTADSVNDVHRVTGPIHEHRPPGLVPQHRDQVVGAEIVGEQSAELRIAILLADVFGVDVATPGQQQREVPVLLHRRQHPRKVRLVVLVRHVPAPIREPPRQHGVADRHRRNDTVILDRLLHPGNVPMRAPHDLHDLAVTAALQQQLQDLSIIRHEPRRSLKRRHPMCRRFTAEQPTPPSATVSPESCDQLSRLALPSRATRHSSRRHHGCGHRYRPRL